MRPLERGAAAARTRESGALSWQAGAAVLGCVAFVAVAIWLALPPDSQMRDTAVPAIPPPPPPSSGEAPASSTVTDSGDGSGRPIAPGKSLRIASDQLPTDGPLVVHLSLPEGSPDSEPLQGRILSSDRRELPLSAAIQGEARSELVVEVPTSFLSPPDRYLVEIRTRERSHFPLRRYVVEVLAEEGAPEAGERAE